MSPSCWLGFDRGLQPLPLEQERDGVAMELEMIFTHTALMGHICGQVKISFLHLFQHIDIPLSSSITLYSHQVEYYVRFPHQIHTFLRLEMWWAAVWIWAFLASPFGSMDIPFKACSRTSIWMASFSLWSASQLGSSKSQAFNFNTLMLNLNLQFCLEFISSPH